jgi:hypothetical protein
MPGCADVEAAVKTVMSESLKIGKPTWPGPRRARSPAGPATRSVDERVRTARFRDLVHVAETCKRLRHGDGGLDGDGGVDLPLEMLTGEQLHLHDIVRVAETCTRFCRGDGGLQTVELPTKSPVVTALCELAFPGGVGIPSTRPGGCSESWVAYLARCAW